MKKLFAVVAVSMAVLGCSVIAAEEKKGPEASKPVVEKKVSEAEAIEAKFSEYLSNFKWPKDSDSEGVADYKMKLNEFRTELGKIFDIKITEVTEKEKAEAYKAKKSEIVENNLKTAYMDKSKGFKWDFDCPKYEKKGKKEKKEKKKKKEE